MFSQLYKYHTASSPSAPANPTAVNGKSNSGIDNANVQKIVLASESIDVTPIVTPITTTTVPAQQPTALLCTSGGNVIIVTTDQQQQW